MYTRSGRTNFFIGALKEKAVIVLSVKGNSVTEDGRILEDRGQRIRDVRVGPDGGAVCSDGRIGRATAESQPVRGIIR